MCIKHHNAVAVQALVFQVSCASVLVLVPVELGAGILRSMSPPSTKRTFGELGQVPVKIFFPLSYLFRSSCTSFFNHPRAPGVDNGLFHLFSTCSTIFCNDKHHGATTQQFYDHKTIVVLDLAGLERVSQYSFTGQKSKY